MVDDSLSNRSTSALSVEAGTAALYAFPVEGKPHFYVIDGLEYGPDSIFSYAKSRLKGKPYERAKAYAWAESKYYAGAGVCELAEAHGNEAHYVDYRSATVHHRVRRDLHMAKTLGIACVSHNSGHGDPIISRSQSASLSELREREGSAHSVSSEIDLNFRMYPWYIDWLDKKLLEGHGIPLDEAIFTAARELHALIGHGAHQTIRGYLQTLTTGADAPYYILSDLKLVLRRIPKEGQNR
jgi:hypothetical protein